MPLVSGVGMNLAATCCGAGQRVAVDGQVWLHKGAYACALDLVHGQHTEAYVRHCVNLARLSQQPRSELRRECDLELPQTIPCPASPDSNPRLSRLLSPVRMFAVRQHGVQLLVVFDGRKLPAKGPEHTRRDHSRRRAELELEQHSEQIKELQAQRPRGGSDPALEAELAAVQRMQSDSAQRAVHVTRQMTERVMQALSQLEGVNVMRAPYEVGGQLRTAPCLSVMAPGGGRAMKCIVAGTR